MDTEKEEGTICVQQLNNIFLQNIIFCIVNFDAYIVMGIPGFDHFRNNQWHLISCKGYTEPLLRELDTFVSLRQGWRCGEPGGTAYWIAQHNTTGGANGNLWILFGWRLVSL